VDLILADQIFEIWPKILVMAGQSWLLQEFFDFGKKKASGHFLVGRRIVFKFSVKYLESVDLILADQIFDIWPKILVMAGQSWLLQLS
jgi:hypothetical protein